MRHYDAVIVGSGPTGSYLAWKLAGAGYRVAVLEREKRPGKKASCTGIISVECATSFAIDGDVVLRQARSARLYSPSGKLLRLERHKAQAYIVDRAALDAVMAGRAEAGGAEYVFDCEAKDVRVGSDRVTVAALHCGKRLNFEARVGVIAAGFGSGLAEGLGLGRLGDFAVGAQAEVETVGVGEVEVYSGQGIAPGFFAWLVPTRPGRALVGLLSRRSPGTYLRRLLSSLVAQGKVVSDNVELRYGGIPLKPLPRTYRERLVVVGDAAGQVKPTTGGGIYYGLLCADIAAGVLCRSLETDDLSAGSLAGYERAWQKKLGRELTLGRWARKFYERLSDRQVDRLFDVIGHDGIAEALLKADDLSFDWHGAAALRLLRHSAVAKMAGVMKLSFLGND
ncbi:MAG: NAD(P)/FAD-dependent oxidoreductase [Chloroflexi bacterium]|nr:NAD(P)/FAD-dependent oxidoreductase [Chloroflexota bacterium]